MIHNLEIASKFQANYTDIIKESRDMIQTHLRDQRERKEIYRDGRLQICILVGLGLVCIWMISGVVTMPGGIIEFLLSSTAGILVLAFELLALAVCLYLAFIKGNK